jgi:two-component system LytT family response regulator
VNSLRIAIVDDEPHVRANLRELIVGESLCTLVGEARSGPEAVKLIADTQPDVVFLDIQLPGGDAFEVLARLPLGPRPIIVLVTAFEEYALRAFDIGVSDYLLKPFNSSRFTLALERARSAHGTARAMGAEEPDTLRRPGVLLLRRDGHVHAVSTNDIFWIEAADNYVRIHARAGRFMMRAPLRQVVEQLLPHGFAQAHRSALINLGWLVSLEPLAGGDNRAHLRDGTVVTVTRAHRDGVRLALAQRFR